MTDNAEGIITTFQEIYTLSLKCKFPDCKHISEVGWAVIEALEKRTIDNDSYVNFQKILKEQERFQITVAEKRKKDRAFGKMIKNYHKGRKKNEY